MKRQFVTTHQLQQQKRNKKSTEVYTPRKSARLNNAQVIIPNQVKSTRKPTLLKNQRDGRGEAEVTSARKSARLVGARPEIIDAALKQKPKSVEVKSAQKSALIKNPQGNDENVNLKSENVRRKLDLHNPIDEGEDVDEGEDIDEGEDLDGDENMDENDIEVR